ncbi:MAG TPA: glycosyltransferase family 2 protein, partial [Planctomycetota bacterium]|nr:glycosyltransferase family 2 protein [Planctomycetota bacterium]
MLRGKTIGVVVPAYNVEHLILRVIDTMPAFVDRIIVVDDASKDRTATVTQERIDAGNTRVVLVRHPQNRGVGAAIGTGYIWARDHGVDVTAVMAGDGQMDPNDLERVVDPVVAGVADYSKGNRIFTDEWRKIPKIRLFGNSALSLMTKVASGYWHSADSQSGYTAISLEALKTIAIDKIYPRYGCPNDILVKLNIYDFRVIDVPIRPVYGVGEKSGMKIPKVVFSIGWLVTKLFFWRLREKYVIRDFHPLVFFYLAAFLLIPTGLGVGGAIIFFNTPLGNTWGPLHVGWIILCALLLISGLQSLFFAMWFDLDYNRANCVFF